MATTTNYGWTTPDDTALVKDGASAIRTLGTSVDTTTKNLNPQTTLGDIAYRSSTSNVNTRLGIGTTGQVLSVSAGVPAWADPSAGANWSLLNAGGTALTAAATVTVSGISGKDKIMVIVSGASTATAGATISVRLNTDTASNYYRYGMKVNAPTTYGSQTIRTTITGAATSMELGILHPSNADYTCNGYVLLTGCNNSGVKVFNLAGTAEESTSTNSGYVLGGYYNSATVISSISVFSSAGNFDAGTVFVYTSA